MRSLGNVLTKTKDVHQEENWFFNGSFIEHSLTFFHMNIKAKLKIHIFDHLFDKKYNTLTPFSIRINRWRVSTAIKLFKWVINCGQFVTLINYLKICISSCSNTSSFCVLFYIHSTCDIEKVKKKWHLILKCLLISVGHEKDLPSSNITEYGKKLTFGIITNLCHLVTFSKLRWSI